jgi:Uma2 family endonuclease
VTVRAAERATRADLEALPSSVAGELIRGVLYAMPRPRPRDQRATGRLFSDLEGPFDRAGGERGGWVILVEPGIALPAVDVDELSPDIAGWRRERLPELPDSLIDVVPDWVCEVLSPSTRAHDQRVKRPLYAQAGVAWMWVVDVDARTVVVSQNESGRWLEVAVYANTEPMAAQPFESHTIQLGDLWG